MTANTLTITFKQREDHREAARERLRRAEAGETDATVAQDARYILNFETFEDIERLMRTSNLELLRAIVTREPESIRDAAAAVDRDYRDVHRNLQELEELGVIEFETSGNRKRPILRGGADSIDLSIRLPGPVDDEEFSGASA